MKERKFRAWDGEKFLNGAFAIWYDGSVDIFQRNGDDVLEQYRRFTGIISEYTGLKDKSGKDIYEGDILNFNNQTDGKVIFNRSRWEFVFGNEKSSYLSFSHYDSKSFEVIGNIFENPELLKND